MIRGYQDNLFPRRTECEEIQDLLHSADMLVVSEMFCIWGEAILYRGDVGKLDHKYLPLSS